MNIGDKRMETPTIWGTCGLEDAGPQPCRVVFLHPDGRFYRVRFTTASGRTFCECFPMRNETRG